jgi:hypothetical protein
MDTTFSLFPLRSTLVLNICLNLLEIIKYRVSYNYRISSSGLSRGHPVDHVKMFKKNCCHFEKNIKVANICSKVPD